MSNIDDQTEENHLPPEAVAEILKYLTGGGKELANASKVSRTWNKASKDPLLLKQGLDEYEEIQDKILKRLNKAVSVLNRKRGLTLIRKKYKSRLLDTLKKIQADFITASDKYKSVRKIVKGLKENKNLSARYVSVGKKQKVIKSRLAGISEVVRSLDPV